MTLCHSSCFQWYRRKVQRRLLPVAAFVFVALFGTYTLIVYLYRSNLFLKAHDVVRHDIPVGGADVQNLIEPGEIQRLYGADELSTEVSSPTAKAMRIRPSLVDVSLDRSLHFRRLLFFEYDLEEKHIKVCSAHKTSNASETGLFPNDAFSLQQRRHGAIILHFGGLIYMFIALAIVCDEYFIPSLGVITETLAISDDVAGATFMAAGGSAPEFFTSVFGVFITQNNVGIGTIVGSATFNILCVLAFCTLFSKEVLQLTWWPLFRDMFFYIFALLLLMMFFLDDAIEVHEALSMFIIYVIYAIIMKYNERLEAAVKIHFLGQAKISASTCSTEAAAMPSISKRISKESMSSIRNDRRKSIPVLQSGALFRSSIPTLAREGTTSEEDNKTTMQKKPNLPPVEEVQVRPTGAANSSKDTMKRTGAAAMPGCVRSVSGYFQEEAAFEPIKRNEISDATSGNRQSSKTAESVEKIHLKHTQNVGDGVKRINESSLASREDNRKESTISNAEKPVDISWPATTSGRIIYICLAPIMLPLYFTLPDAKRTSSKRFFIVTFIGSIFWIAFFSYLMVWWANTIGETLGISNEIMGLTVLAAGTSVPDLITSVIVARKGLGDMAVSSSIGSNLFDICIGLPVPWLLHFSFDSLLHPMSKIRGISVSSKGLICSVGLLFLMLLVLIITVAASRWRMNKLFGFVMITSYILFCVFSVFLEIGSIICPLRTNTACV